MSSTNVETVTVAPPIATEESGASTSAEVPVSKTSDADRLCVFCKSKYKRVKYGTNLFTRQKEQV